MGRIDMGELLGPAAAFRWRRALVAIGFSQLALRYSLFAVRECEVRNAHSVKRTAKSDHVRFAAKKPEPQAYPN
jgi:hypothetical protein